MTTRNIAVIVGSLRKDSFTRKVAQSMIELAPASLNMEIVEIRDLPLYNQDDETDNPPASFTVFRERVKQADGILFCTPEYNRSVTGALKNAIDVGSRPYGASVWDGKPGAVASVSPGTIGGFGANYSVRQAVVFLNVPMMPAPEAYWGQAGTFFDENGELINDATRKVMTRFIQAYGAWVERLAGSR